MYFNCVSMLHFSVFLDNLTILFTYMFIYNLSLFTLFWSLNQFISSEFKTIYSFNDFKFNFYTVTVISVVLFSIAGVPPFLGFFSKILILITLINSNFFFFYIFFFALLFFGLYFYLQNIRFLYATNFSSVNYSHTTNIRLVSNFFYFSTFITFLLVFGFFFFFDFIIFFSWLFI